MIKDRSRHHISNESRKKIVKLHDEEGLSFTTIGKRFGRNPSAISTIYREEKDKERRHVHEQ